MQTDLKQDSRTKHTKPIPSDAYHTIPRLRSQQLPSQMILVRDQCPVDSRGGLITPSFELDLGF
jgi:hypothetical protein